MTIALIATASAAQDVPVAAVPTLAPAQIVTRWTAEEARQGAAADARHFYAISNNRIGKYNKKSGRRVAQWQGSKAQFPHMNSCVVDRTQLICAASNYPAVPMASAIEIFDAATLRHIRSITLPPLPGSLTWIERRGKDWFAGLANYPVARGGEAGHDHRWTSLVRLDAGLRPTGLWHFPDSVLARFAPMSCSGGTWGTDGLLYVTGHDLPELYALRLPKAGTVLEHIATIPLPTGGQAISWDPSAPRTLWSLDRATKQVVASRIGAIDIKR
ncbi:hypothetical protein [Sphingomonas sp. PB4P5]|uniref:hypothetical protein n=1 Tax=Parasphingomonas puruogangriensis TaxID=3096155 RepID=UPI002FC7D8E9